MDYRWQESDSSRLRSRETLAKMWTPAALTRYVAALIQGLGVQHASGATKPELYESRDVALQYMGYLDEGQHGNHKENQAR